MIRPYLIINCDLAISRYDFVNKTAAAVGFRIIRFLPYLALTTFPFFTFALAGCLQSFHPTHAQLSNRNGKFVFSGTFHIMWVEVGQGILLNRSIF